MCSNSECIYLKKEAFWINFHLGQKKKKRVSCFVLIDGVELVDCGFRVVESLFLLLAVSEIFLVKSEHQFIAECLKLLWLRETKIDRAT